MTSPNLPVQPVQPVRRRRRGRRQRSGFTLVEMIVAAILLIMGVTAALACISGATRSTGIASEYTNASHLAQQRFAELEAQVATGQETLSSGEQNGSFGDEFPGYTWTQSVETSSDITNLFRVTLTVEWPSGSSRRQTVFVTYVMGTPTTTGSAQ